MAKFPKSKSMFGDSLPSVVAPGLLDHRPACSRFIQAPLLRFDISVRVRPHVYDVCVFSRSMHGY